MPWMNTFNAGKASVFFHYAGALERRALAVG
ncbi:hypothetical protein PS843_05304 [Pseudomonas fluorescens]|jgi:hypothetical protein|nr:hypothetical protein PS843_05304 [Pseudomonas fluorescens]